MTTPPDFYLYHGEGNQAVLRVLRACRRIGTIEHQGHRVFLVSIEPPIPLGYLPDRVKTDVIAMSQHGPKPLDRLAPGDTGSALVWEVYDLGGGKLGVGIEPSIGRATIYKTKPALDSRGIIIDAPAARAVVSSIIRALESDDRSTKK